jgi:regulatory protein
MRLYGPGRGTLDTTGPGNSRSDGESLPGSFSSTYDRALKLLGFRARSVAELRRQLLRKGEPSDAVDQAIERLCAQKLLDDAEFARQFARTKLLAAGASRRRIVQELSQRGVPRELADHAIADLWEKDGLDPADAVRRIAEKKWKSLGRFDDLTRRRRLYAFLARRGFNPDEIKSVMTTLGEHRDE